MKKEVFKLWDLGHQCNLVQHACNMKLRPEIRRFYEAMHLVQQLHDIKWWIFALFLTLYLEFQLKAWFPDEGSAQIQANISAVFMVGMFFVIYGAQQVIMSRTACPVELSKLLSEGEQEYIERTFIEGLPLPPNHSASKKELSKAMFQCIEINDDDSESVQDAKAKLVEVSNVSSGGRRFNLRPLSASDL